MKRRERVVHACVHTALLCVMAITLMPILYALSVSLSGTNTFMSSRFSLLPADFTLEHYRQVLFERPFFRWFLNSVLLSAFSMVLALGVSVPAGYALSRWGFPGKRAILKALLLLNAFPAILSMVGIYRLFRTLGLINTYAGLAIAYAGMMVIFGIWNMKGYFDTLPQSAEEAAAIDGCTPLRVLWSVVLPVAMPAIVVTATLVFITSWNEYIYAISFISDRDRYTLAAGLYSLQGTEFTRNWPQFAAGSLIVTVPVLAVFFAIQRFMVGGLSSGGTKL